MKIADQHRHLSAASLLIIAGVHLHFVQACCDSQMLIGSRAKNSDCFLADVRIGAARLQMVRARLPRVAGDYLQVH